MGTEANFLYTATISPIKKLWISNFVEKNIFWIDDSDARGKKISY